MRLFQKIILFQGALVFSILLVVVVLILPTLRDVRTMRTNLLTEQEQLERRYQQGLLIKRLREDWEKITPEINTINAAVLTYEKGIPFITRLEELAAANNIAHRLSLSLPDMQSQQKETATLPFEMQWQGSWRNLLKLLAALEQEPYYLSIDAIAVAGSQFTTAQPLPTASFQRAAPTLNRAPEKEKIETTIAMTIRGTAQWRKN